MNTFTRKRGLTGLALAGVISISLVACAAAPEEGEGPAEEVDFLACAVSDEASFQDKSFNEAVSDGLDLAATELGITTPIKLESGSQEQFKPNLDQTVTDGCDVTFAVGFNFSLDGSIFDVAEENPEQHFVWIDGWNEGQSNLKPIAYNMAESSYLAGYLAAGYSTTKVIGTYGGQDIEAVTDFMDGYYYGAQAWAADNDTEVTVVGRNPATGTGDFTDGFGDAAGAKSITDGQIAAGADVLFPVAGALFETTYASIEESGKDVVFIGVDKDIALTSPQYADKVLTSVEKRMTQAVYDVIAELVDGADFSIDPYVGTLANDGTALSDFYDVEVDEALVAKLEELKQGIIDGDIDPLA